MADKYTLESTKGVKSFPDRLENTYKIQTNSGEVEYVGELIDISIRENNILSSTIALTKFKKGDMEGHKIVKKRDFPFVGIEKYSKIGTKGEWRIISYQELEGGYEKNYIIENGELSSDYRNHLKKEAERRGIILTDELLNEVFGSLEQKCLDFIKDLN